MILGVIYVINMFDVIMVIINYRLSILAHLYLAYIIVTLFQV